MRGRCRGGGPSGSDRFLVVAVLVSSALRVPGLMATPSSDEAGFLLVARTWAPDADSLYGQYWVDRPPVLLAAYRWSDALLGELGPRLLAMVLAAVLVVAVHLLAARLDVTRRRAGGDRGDRGAARRSVPVRVDVEGRGAGNAAGGPLVAARGASAGHRLVARGARGRRLRDDRVRLQAEPGRRAGLRGRPAGRLTFCPTGCHRTACSRSADGSRSAPRFRSWPVSPGSR